MKTNKRTEHRFGGGWTEIKLDAVSDYLTFYTQALEARPKPDNPFETWYIDAFAGTGDRTLETEPAGLFSPPDETNEFTRLDGSARRALSIEPPFRHLVFIEKDTKRFAALQNLKEEFPNRDVQCVHGDANNELRQIFDQSPWRDPRRRGLQRAVVFLDPYGMAVRWDTLRFLAETQRADVWYLFPLHAALRQLSHKHTALDGGKRKALGEVFGTNDWEQRFYQPSEQPATDLFEAAVRGGPDRIADAESVEAFAAERLRSIFSFVSRPIPILTHRKLRQFSLFLLSGNPSDKAIALIKNGVAAQIKKYGGQ